MIANRPENLSNMSGRTFGARRLPGIQSLTLIRFLRNTLQRQRGDRCAVRCVMRNAN